MCSFPGDYVTRLKYWNPEPNETWRLEMLKAHATNAKMHSGIGYQSVANLYDELDVADMRSICTEDGLLTI